jgi:membrane-associated protein
MGLARRASAVPVAQHPAPTAPLEALRLPALDVLFDPLAFVKLLLDPPTLIKAAGAAGLLAVVAMVFAESGLFFGFFLPGDSLLFTAGFLASQGFFDTWGGIWTLSVLCGLAAILGDSVGYAFGKRVGPRLFNREDSRWFHKQHLRRAHDFYERHGGKAIVLARFMPLIRTFAPIVAGMGAMHYPRFLAYNALGGLLWGMGLTWAGYSLTGALESVGVKDVDKLLLPIVAVIILLSVAPGVIHLWRESRGQVTARARARLAGKGEGLGGSNS